MPNTRYRPTNGEGQHCTAEACPRMVPEPDETPVPSHGPASLQESFMNIPEATVRAIEEEIPVPVEGHAPPSGFAAGG